MIVAVLLTVSKIGRGQRSKGSGHNEIDYSSLNVHIRTVYWIFMETLGPVQID